MDNLDIAYTCMEPVAEFMKSHQTEPYLNIIDVQVMAKLRCGIDNFDEAIKRLKKVEKKLKGNVPKL